MGDSASYASQWRDLRLRAALSWITVAAVPLSVVGANVLLPSISIGQLLLVALPFFLTAIGFGAYKSSFRCPRCNKPFFEKGIWQNNFARRCMNCGLPRDAEPGMPS